MMWIENGVRFQCEPDCGKCCTSANRDGKVYLEAFDIEALAEHLEMKKHIFAEEFVESENEHLVLKKTEKRCCFLKDATCTVHEARPVQCRSYPFLPLTNFSPIQSQSSWISEKNYCPGIDSGRLYSKKEIINITRGQAEAPGFNK